MTKGPTDKNLFRVFLLIAALVLLIAGCGQNNKQLDTQETEATGTAAATSLPTPRSYTPTPAVTNTPSPSPEPVNPLGIEPEDLSSVNIQFWHTWSGSAGEAIDEIVDTFNSQNQWGIQVQAAYQGDSDENSANIQAAIANRQPPNIGMGTLYQAIGWNSSWELADINVYINDPMWGLSSEDLDDFYPAFWEHDFYKDKRIGVPAQRSGQVLYYSQSWGEELGFSAAPVSPEEFKEQACAAARYNLNDENPDNDGSGGLIISSNYSAMLGWMNAFGAEVAASDRSSSVQNGSEDDGYNFDNPQVEDSLTFLRELYDEGCAWISDYPYPEVDFAARRALFATDSITGIPYQQDAMQQAGSGDRWTIISFPSPTNGAGINVYGPSFEIFQATPEEDLAAWLFIKWLISTQNQARLIEATGAFPLRTSILEHLKENETLPPQWFAASQALASARPEPPFESWNLVRWAVSDAATQLFRYYFTIDQIPELVAFLDKTANDLHRDPLQDSSINTPTPTATATLEVTPTSAAPPESTPTP